MQVSPASGSKDRVARCLLECLEKFKTSKPSTFLPLLLDAPTFLCRVSPRFVRFERMPGSVRFTRESVRRFARVLSVVAMSSALLSPSGGARRRAKGKSPDAIMLAMRIIENGDANYQAAFVRGSSKGEKHRARCRFLFFPPWDWGAANQSEALVEANSEPQF